MNDGALKPIWNADHIAGIEIGNMETDDVAGRLRYFEATGVIRDVVQNHLMEMLLLVTAKLTVVNGGMRACEKSKLDVLKGINNITEGTFVNEVSFLFLTRLEVLQMMSISIAYRLYCIL